MRQARLRELAKKREDDSRKEEVMKCVLDPLVQRIALQEASLVCEEDDRRDLIRNIQKMRR